MHKLFSSLIGAPPPSIEGKKRLLGRSIDLKQFKKELQLTRLQKEVLPGILLGDAHLSTQDNGKSYRLHISQSIKHKEYVYHLYGIFKEFCLLEPTIKGQTHKSGVCRGKTYQTISFKTVSLPLFKFFGRLFHCNLETETSSSKRVPRDISRWLRSIGLAYWFMDDGSTKGKNNRAVYLHTQGFTLEEVDILCGVLISKFKCKAKPVKKKGQYVIYVSAKSFFTLNSHISPFLLKEMRYKFPNKPAY